jgi:uncharacterized protein YegP (UPF0339 family)
VTDLAQSGILNVARWCGESSVAHTYEIYRDKAGEYRVRFKYNSETIWSSEGLSSKASALNLIESIKKNVTWTPVDDLTSDQQLLIDRLRNAQIPASDRVVNIDHNSGEFRDFKKAFEKFEENLRVTNDFGRMSSDEIDVAKFEAARIGPEGQRPLIRPAHVWITAKSTLLWIVQQAAGSIIGALALAVLAALATMLGIPF